MQSPDLQNSVPKKATRRIVICGLLVLATVAASIVLLYPRYQASRWEEELVTTADAFELHELIGKILRAENTYADDMLAKHCERVENAVFAKEHRAVLLVSNDTGQPYSVSRWTATTMSPNITARFARPRIVENRPEAVTIAVTNQVNGLTFLFVFSYRHVGHVCDLSDAEFETWKQDGFWNRYVQEHGNPIAGPRERWTTFEEKRYLEWRKTMEEQFAIPTPDVE